MHCRVISEFCKLIKVNGEVQEVFYRLQETIAQKSWYPLSRPLILQKQAQVPTNLRYENLGSRVWKLRF